MFQEHSPVGASSSVVAATLGVVRLRVLIKVDLAAKLAVSVAVQQMAARVLQLAAAIITTAHLKTVVARLAALTATAEV